MATKKGGGSTRNGRDTAIPKHRGIKRFGGELVKAGHIIVRQCGTKFHPGTFVGKGRDGTLYALIAGYVKFHLAGKQQKRCVSIVPYTDSIDATDTTTSGTKN